MRVQNSDRLSSQKFCMHYLFTSTVLHVIPPHSPHAVASIDTLVSKLALMEVPGSNPGPIATEYPVYNNRYATSQEIIAPNVIHSSHISIFSFKTCSQAFVFHYLPLKERLCFTTTQDEH